MVSNRKGALVLLLCGLAGLASAQSSGVPSIGDLDRVQAAIIIAEARLQLANAKQSLAKVEGDVDGDSAGKEMPPVVTGVYGTDKDTYARFLMEGGAQMVGRAGDVLPGGYRVVQVSVTKVVISDAKGGKRVARFSRNAPTSDAEQTDGRLNPASGLPTPGRPLPRRAATR